MQVSPRANAPRVQISALVQPDIKDALMRQAAQERRSMAFLVENALRAYVETLPTQTTQTTQAPQTNQPGQPT